MEMIEHGRDAFRPIDRQAPDHRPSDHHRARAERERLENIGAATDAAVDIDLGLVADRLDDLTDNGRGRDRSIEMPAAVIGHHDGARAVFGAGERVVAAQHALDDHRNRRALDQPFQFAPGRRIHDLADEVGMIGGARHRPARHVDVENIRRRFVLLARGARRPAADRRVDGQHQRGEPCLDQPVDQRFDLGPVRPVVKLEPLRRVAPFLRHVFDQNIGIARHDIGGAGSGGAARGGAFAERMEQLVTPGRRHHDRRRHLLAEQRDAGIDRGDVAQHARAKPQRAPGIDAFDQADFVVGAASAERVGSRRHLGARLMFKGIEIDTIHVSLPVRKFRWPHITRNRAGMPGERP